MSDGKVPMQASGQGSKGAAKPDGVNSQGGNAGSGERYANQQEQPGGGQWDDVAGHGGQSKIGYHGPGQLGDEQVGEANPNATAAQKGD